VCVYVYVYVCVRATRNLMIDTTDTKKPAIEADRGRKMKK
jgi:hypothetical protein